MCTMKPLPSDAWPKLPPLPNAAVRLKDFLETINRKGVATRSDLLRLPFVGSSTQLDSWLEHTVNQFKLVEEIPSKRSKCYRKTRAGREMEQVLSTYWDYVRRLLTMYSEDRRIPLFSPPFK